MDEQVKARLIGATVLVVIAVALVPELLSGPRRAAETEPVPEESRGMRTVTIDIGGGAGPATVSSATAPASGAAQAAVDAPGAAAEVPADAGATESGDAVPAAPPVEPAEIGPPAATVATTGSVSPAPAAAEPAPRPQPAAQAASGRGWSVQVGAFSAAATARKLVADLGRDGLPAYVAPLERGGKTLHRVRVGPVASKAEADQLAARLKSKGMPGSVVAPD